MNDNTRHMWNQLRAALTDARPRPAALQRRGFLTRLAKGCLGVSVLPVTSSLIKAAETDRRTGAAKHVIYLYMNGAMSQLDTFDPKPGREVQGDTEAIQTNVSGILLSQHLPELAKQANRLAIVRGMTTETGAHEPGQYLMKTSYEEIASTRHPFLGSWLQRIDGKLNNDLPGSVVVGGANRHPGAGWLGADYAPAPVGDPNAGLQNTKAPKYLREAHFDKRLRLTTKFERAFKSRHKQAAVGDYVEFYREATKLMKSKDLLAFDISEEPEEVRTAYGDNTLGQGCLLARRLVERKVRFVEVEYGGWDNHREIFESIPERAQHLDQALSALLTDLSGRGLLQQTLVVVATEFGRTPNINQNTGRDHHPGAFSCVLAGGGIRGGQIHGATDEDAHSVEDGHTYPADFNATIAYGLGLPLDEEFHSPQGRPFKVAHDGTPIESLYG